MSRKISGVLVAAMALAAVVGTSTRADAALIAYICDDMLCTGGNDTIVTDGGPGDNFPGSATPGQINSGAVFFNGFTIITNVTQSKPLIGSAAAPNLDLTYQVISNGSTPNTVFLYASDTGFTGSGVLNLQLGGTQDVGAGNSIQARAWGGTSNNNLDISGANLRANTGGLLGSPYAVTANGVLPSGVSPYSLTIGVNITRSTPGSTTGDLNVTVVPEPASMALFGLGLMGVGAFNRRRRANQAK